MQTLEIKAQEFIAGESSSEFNPDGGFSPKSYGLNLLYKKGELHFQPAGTQLGAAVLTGNIVASCNDETYSGNEKHFIDDEGAFYHLNGTTLTKAQTGTGTFQYGTTDILQFNGYTYATSQDSLHQLTGSNLTSCERLWGATFTATYRHPIERVENSIYVSDGNIVYYLNSAGATGIAFTLPTNQVVTSLRRHPDGRTLLAFTGDNLTNYSHTKSGGGKVYFCNPVTLNWDREVVIHSQVEGTRVVGGIIYCTFGTKFGYFDGNGLQPLRDLETSTYVYSHGISNMEDIVLVADGIYVKAFGDLGAGRVWWKLFNNPANSNYIQSIAFNGGKKLLTCFQGASAGTGVLYSTDYSTFSYGGTFYSKHYSFGREINIRKIVVLHDTTNSAGTSQFYIYHYDAEDTEEKIHEFIYTNESSKKSEINCDVKTDMFQFRLRPQSSDLGFKLIRIYYEPIE